MNSPYSVSYTSSINNANFNPSASKQVSGPLLELLRRLSTSINALSLDAQHFDKAIIVMDWVELVTQRIYFKSLVKSRLAWAHFCCNIKSAIKKSKKQDSFLRSLSKLHHKLDSMDTLITNSQRLQLNFDQINDVFMMYQYRSSVLSIDSTELQFQLDEVAVSINSMTSQFSELKQELALFNGDIERLVSLLYENCELSSPISSTCKVSIKELNAHLKAFADNLMLSELANRKKFNASQHSSLKFVHLFHDLSNLESICRTAEKKLEAFCSACKFYDIDKQLQGIVKTLKSSSQLHPSIQDICSELSQTIQNCIQDSNALEQDIYELMQDILKLEKKASMTSLYKKLVLECQQQIKLIQTKISSSELII